MKKSHGKSPYYMGPKFGAQTSAAFQTNPCLHGTRGFKMTNPNTAPFQEKSFKISIYSICIVGFTPKWAEILMTLKKNPSKNVSSFQVVINLKIFGQGWSVALTALKHSTFSATVLKPHRWRDVFDVFRGFVFTSREQMPRSTPPFPGGCWGLWKWWEHCGNSSWIQAVLGGCLGNFLGGMVVFSLVMFCSLRWQGNRK